MNEWTHFFMKIYLSHFILERVDVGCVWEVSWRRGQTATYWPKVLLIIAAHLSHLGWVAQPGSLRAQSPPSATGSQFSILSPTDSNWNWPKPSVAHGYIIVLCPPASTVPPLIYTGASLDWQLGWGSVYNKIDGQDMLDTAWEVRKYSNLVFFHSLLHLDIPARTYLHELCVDTRYSLEDLPKLMDNWDWWWESGKSMLLEQLGDDDDSSATRMALALNNQWKFDMPLNKETEKRFF